MRTCYMEMVDKNYKELHLCASKEEIEKSWENNMVYVYEIKADNYQDARNKVLREYPNKRITDKCIRELWGKGFFNDI